MAERGAATTGSLRAAAPVLGLLLFATYAYFLPGLAWNEASRFNLVRSLVERQALDIDPYHRNTEDKALFGGHYYSDKAPGAAFLAVPAYGAYYGLLRLLDRPLPQVVAKSELLGVAPVGGEDPVLVNAAFRRGLYLSNLATNGVAAVALGLGFFLLLGRLGVEPRLALLFTSALAFGTLVFPYATLFYGHVLAAAALFGVFLLFRPFRANLEPLGRGRLLGAGGLAGLAVLCEYPAVLGAAALAVFVIARSGHGQRWRTVAWFVAGAAPFAALLLGYQAAAFGSPFSTGYAKVANPTFAEGMARGILGVSWPRPGALFGMLFGRARGLLYVGPVLVFGFIGLFRRASWEPFVAERRLCLVVVLAFLLMSAGYYMWWGGAALGPRHVIPMLPFVCLAMPFALGPGRWWRWAFAGLLAVSMANFLFATAVSPLADRGVDVLFDHVYPPLVEGRVALLSGAANLGMSLGLAGPKSLLPLVGLWVLGFVNLWSTLRPSAGAAEP